MSKAKVYSYANVSAERETFITITQDGQRMRFDEDQAADVVRQVMRNLSTKGSHTAALFLCDVYAEKVKAHVSNVDDDIARFNQVDDVVEVIQAEVAGWIHRVLILGGLSDDEIKMTFRVNADDAAKGHLKMKEMEK